MKSNINIAAIHDFFQGSAQEIGVKNVFFVLTREYLGDTNTRRMSNEVTVWRVEHEYPKMRIQKNGVVIILNETGDGYLVDWSELAYRMGEAKEEEIPD